MHTFKLIFFYEFGNIFLYTHKLLSFIKLNEDLEVADSESDISL